MVSAHNYVHNFDFVLHFGSRLHDKNCLYTLSSFKNSFFFHFDSQRKHDLLICNLQRQFTLSILTYTVNTLSYIFHLQSQLTLSHFHLQGQHIFSISTHRDSTLSYTATYRDNSLFPF